MNEYFNKLISNISLTKKQREDALTKYTGVCKTLNNEFYDSEYSDAVKFLFGSYKKKTTISCPEKDVDVIFKIPEEKFTEYQKQENGPSNLLTKVKNTLKNTYTTTDKIKNWTKVVLVDFSTFKVEVLPAFEREDKKFIIPNTGDGEDWSIFDPRSEIINFENSNKQTSELTRNLTKIIKKWKIVTGGVNIKTYILDTHIINFLKNYSFTNYPELMADFFAYLYDIDKETYIETAKNRTEKAYDFYKNGKIDNAVEEYIKVFGNDFPKTIESSELSENYEQAPNEEFIENMVSINIDPSANLKINCRVEQNGWRPALLDKMSFLSKNKKLEFFIEKNNIPQPFEVKWKVRNFGEEAKKRNDLRGEISDDIGFKTKKENTRYKGTHYVECYIIKNDICIAKDKIIVPISNI